MPMSLEVSNVRQAVVLDLRCHAWTLTVRVERETIKFRAPRNETYIA